MKKFIALLLTAAILLMVGCTASTTDKKTTENTETTAAQETTTQTTSKPEGKKFVLKFSNVGNEKDGQSIGMMKFKEVIEELTDGQIEVQLYLNSSLYNQDAATEALVSGELEMNMTSIQLTAEYVPMLNMLAAPYIFKSYDHIQAIFNSGNEVGEYIYNEVAEKANYIPLSSWYNGSRQLGLRTTKPIVKPEDLDGVLLRMPNSASWIAAGESLGAKVTPLAFGEVYTALQTGTIDAQDNPLPTVKGFNFHEVTKQISLTYHILDAIWPAINKDVWEQMDADLQAKMYQAIEEGRKACDESNLKNEAELVEFFKGEGLIITEPDVDAFAKHSYEYFESKGLTKDWDMDLYNKIRALAE
jgi:tripartite ATP-independent transporter DctP family solute receptor